MYIYKHSFGAAIYKRIYIYMYIYTHSFGSMDVKQSKAPFERVT